MIFLYFFLQVLNDSFRCIDTDITHNENLFDLFIEIVINIGKSIEYRINAGNNIIPRLAQSGNQTAPEAFFFFAHLFFLVSI